MDGLTVSALMAYKSYVARLNWKRGRYSKLGVKSLTRNQKQQAIINHVFETWDVTTWIQKI